MKLITRDTDYAIRAVCRIGKGKGKIVTTSELVKSLKIPRPFLRKILQILNKKRILHSTKGKGGGFILAKPAKKVFLLDLIRIFQGPLKINECTLKKAPCPSTRVCKLKKKIDRIQRFVVSELKDVNLEYLQGGKG